ncbi:Uncharacterized protein APZ42_001262 [Daphnia magna]|uniref:Uncharacterized protein n=1 Tax=Daphnia magna TaxID=35525 RepID=A0A164J391_9CRUS|nr:Uncharacterized protein APZ42_001262 [Daphnia magna]
MIVKSKNGLPWWTKTLEIFPNSGSPSLVSELGVSRTTECLRYSHP